jgi:hypothetical protein
MAMAPLIVAQQIMLNMVLRLVVHVGGIVSSWKALTDAY